MPWGRAGVRDARAFLESHGISGRLATKLAMRYRGDTEAYMREDPCAPAVLLARMCRAHGSDLDNVMAYWATQQSGCYWGVLCTA